MYVRKFEADSLEEALSEIKRELGPDAIILKTVTNKGLRGAFKKKKIEITVAISEKNYTKKARTDHVLTDEQKGKFYQNNASYVANMIDEHSKGHSDSSRTTTKVAPGGGYGGLGLNKSVRTAKQEAGPEIKTALDDFLSTREEVKSEVVPIKSASMVERQEENFSQEEIEKNSEELSNFLGETAPKAQSHVSDISEKKLFELEKKVFELSKLVEKVERRGPEGLYQLRNTLASLDINEGHIQRIMRKASVELSDEELVNPDFVFEFALKEMLSVIKTAQPLFASPNVAEKPVITVLLSETSSGQTSMMLKLGALKNDSILIRCSKGESVPSLTEKMYDMKVITTKGIAEAVFECRKAVESGKSVFIDYKNENGEVNEVKKFVDGLKRSFDNVEVLASISAIHAEVYNRKVMSHYRQLVDGMTISHIDLCLNFGALFNLAEDLGEVPFKFFGTGQMVPDDLEAATAERILAGIFQL